MRMSGCTTMNCTTMTTTMSASSMSTGAYSISEALPFALSAWLFCTASTTARSAHATTSLSAAQASVMEPSCSFWRPFSVMMRASTGKAVTDMHVPTKSWKDSCGTALALSPVPMTSWLLYRCGASAKAPRQKGIATETSAMMPALPLVFFSFGTSTSRPTTNMKTTTPSCAHTLR